MLIYLTIILLEILTYHLGFDINDTAIQYLR